MVYVNFFARGEHHIEYKKGYHIPVGGNYFCKTKFLSSEPQFDCYMIAAAFADFRNYIPVFIPYTERPFYYSYYGIGTEPKNSEHLDSRLKMDMEGVIKTALAQNVEVLILGASGCGAFLHDPYREARLWKEVLNDSVLHCFDEICFSILPDKSSPNIQAFFTIATNITSSWLGEHQVKIKI